MLKIHIGSIPPDNGVDLDERLEAQRLPLLKAVADDGSVVFVQPVHTRLHARLVGESVMLEGHVETSVRLTCSRCLALFQSTIEADFSLTALPEIAVAEPFETGDEIELSKDEMDAVAYQGDIIDLREEIGQQIIMALPFQPLCRKTCKGLCSRCGADLNQTSCRCRRQHASSPFDVLKKLSLPPDEDA